METLSKFYYKFRVNLFPFKCFLFLVKLRYNCLISFWLKKGKLVAILEIFLFQNCLKRCRNICFEGRRFLQDIVTTKFTKKKIKSLKIIKNIKMQLILIFCTIKRNFFFDESRSKDGTTQRRRHQATQQHDWGHDNSGVLLEGKIWTPLKFFPLLYFISMKIIKTKINGKKEKEKKNMMFDQWM